MQFAVWRDQNRHGQNRRLVVTQQLLGIIDKCGELDPQYVYRLLKLGPFQIVVVHTQHCESIRGFIQMIQLRYLIPARPTPVRPVVDKHPLSLPKLGTGNIAIGQAQRILGARFGTAEQDQTCEKQQD